MKVFSLRKLARCTRWLHNEVSGDVLTMVQKWREGRFSKIPIVVVWKRFSFVGEIWSRSKENLNFFSNKRVIFDSRVFLRGVEWLVGKVCSNSACTR